jgi:hypothetical protein
MLFYSVIEQPRIFIWVNKNSKKKIIRRRTISLGNHRSALRDCVLSRKCKPDHLKAFIKGAESCMKLEKYQDAQTWCSTGLSVSFFISIFFFFEISLFFP